MYSINIRYASNLQCSFFSLVFSQTATVHCRVIYIFTVDEKYLGKWILHVAMTWKLSVMPMVLLTHPIYRASWRALCWPPRACTCADKYWKIRRECGLYTWLSVYSKYVQYLKEKFLSVPKDTASRCYLISGILFFNPEKFVLVPELQYWIYLEITEFFESETS
jgi:hypothetical protein